MGRHLSLPLAFVVVNDLLRVDGQSAVGVDRDTEQAGVCLWKDMIKYYNFFVVTAYKVDGVYIN